MNYDLSNAVQVIKISNKGEIKYIHDPGCELTNSMEKLFGGKSEKLSDIEFSDGWYAKFKTGEVLGPFPTYADCVIAERKFAISRFIGAGA